MGCSLIKSVCNELEVYDKKAHLIILITMQSFFHSTGCCTPHPFLFGTDRRECASVFHSHDVFRSDAGRRGAHVAYTMIRSGNKTDAIFFDIVLDVSAVG